MEGVDKDKIISGAVFTVCVWGTIDITRRVGGSLLYYGCRTFKAIGVKGIAGNFASSVAIKQIGERVIPFIREKAAQNIKDKDWKIIGTCLHAVLGTAATKAVFIVLGGVTWKWAIAWTVINIAIMHFMAEASRQDSVQNDGGSDEIEPQNLKA